MCPIGFAAVFVLIYWLREFACLQLLIFELRFELEQLLLLYYKSVFFWEAIIVPLIVCRKVFDRS